MNFPFFYSVLKYNITYQRQNRGINMKYQEYNINQAKGIRLFEAVRLDGMVLEKGHVLNDEDIIQLKLSGIKKIFGAAMGDNDLDVMTALGILSAKLCGSNTAFAIGTDGVSRIVADKDGIMVAADDRIAKFNRLSPELILNVIPPYSEVKSGEVIAELELTVPVIAAAQVDEIVFSLSGNVPLLQLAALEEQKATLLYTKFYNDKTETAHFTRVVTKLVKEFKGINLLFSAEHQAPHEIEKVADVLEIALKGDSRVIFIIPGQRNGHREDVVAAAVRSVADEIVSFSIPQVGVSDLLIATKRDKRIIVLPFNYDRVDGSLINHYIKLSLLNDKITLSDFSHPQNVLIPRGQMFNQEDNGELIRSSGKNKPGDANVAVVVLAAGASRRAGRNKLLYEVDGEPLFLKAVRAAVRSQASPVFVITGDHASDFEEALENIDVNIVYNPAYRSGIKTSINLGLKSVPNFCDGVILLPADMPNITPEFINKMIKSFDKKAEKQVVTASLDGVKSNPVLWSKSLYEVADLVPENAELRPVLIEHSDYAKSVKGDKNLLLDVNYPNDLEQLAN